MNIIAENIARRRKELGMTQKELAEKLNISDKTLSRWETDKQVPDALAIPEIVKVLEMSIGELYGITESSTETKSFQKNKINMDNNSIKEELDYARITTYKIVLFAGSFFLVLGSGIYGFMGTLWNQMKFGALILFICGLAAFLIGELTFEEFYQRKENPGIYEKIHKQWFGIAVPLVGLLMGIVIPSMKTPTTTLFNNWDTILPLLLFQGCVLLLYRRDKTKNPILHHIFISVGIICIIGFLINVSNNPYRYMGGVTYEDWEIDALWFRIKFFEFAAGFAFFFMNILHSKNILGFCEKVVKKVAKIIVIGIVVVSVVSVTCIHVTNKNLQERITYTSGEVPMYQLTNYSHTLIDWIEECNLSGEEICIRESMVSRDGKTANAYLIYLPHGYEDTEMKIHYRVGFGLRGNVLKIEVENTTQIVDDNYYLCYMEVLNNWDGYEVQTYLNGERLPYMQTSVGSNWNVFE